MVIYDTAFIMFIQYLVALILYLADEWPALKY